MTRIISVDKSSLFRKFLQRNKKSIIHSYSSFEEDSSETKFSESEFKEGQSSRVIHGKMRPSYIPNPYLQRPHTRPKNKLILASKLIANPAFRDEIINIDESPDSEEKSSTEEKSKQKGH